MPGPQAKVIDLIEKTSVIPVIDSVSPKDLDDSSTDKNLRPSLHALFRQVAPKESRVREQYHWKNLRLALLECDDDEKTATAIANLYCSYYLNFGRKFMLIEQLAPSAQTQPEETTAPSLFPLTPALDSASILHDESPEAQESPLEVIGAVGGQGNDIALVLRESISTFSFETPDDSLLSEAGRQFKNNMKVKKRTVVTGYHKVIIDADRKLRIFLIDPITLVKESPGDKALAVLQAVSRFGVKADFCPPMTSRVAFFQAIDALYKDNDLAAGQVWGGYFYTSAGTRFLNNSRGSGTDLRKDPFQMGGIQASPQSPVFIKLEVGWPDVGASVDLNGTGDMLNNPQTSLTWIEVTFSTINGGNAAFLAKVLDYAYWG
jgi:hypothetical protein